MDKTIGRLFILAGSFAVLFLAYKVGFTYYTNIVEAKPSEVLTAHVNQKWAEELNAVDIKTVLISESRSKDQIEICDQKTRSFGACNSGIFVNTGSHDMRLYRGVSAEYDGNKWIVFAPTDIKQLHSYSVRYYLDEALTALVERGKRRKDIAESWASNPSD